MVNRSVNPMAATGSRRRPRRSLAEPSRGFVSFKRCLDVVLALVGLTVTLPIIGLCAMWIKIVDGGPVFYSQWRVGRNGWLFKIYKLRTMLTRAERYSGAQFASSNDPRIIDRCQWMRKSHVDELPQFWNILVGQMSLVGPRPERPEMHEALRKDIPKIGRRLASRPGLTGLAQVRNGYANNLVGARRKLADDLRYLRRRSVRGEVGLLLKTIPKVWDEATL